MVILPVITIASGLTVDTFTALSLTFQASFALLGAMDLVALQSSSVLVSFVAMSVMARAHASETDIEGEANAMYVTRNVLAHFPTPVLAWIYVIRHGPSRFEYGLFAFNVCAALLIFWKTYGDFGRLYGSYTHMSEEATFSIYMSTLFVLAVITRYFVRDRG